MAYKTEVSQVVNSCRSEKVSIFGDMVICYYQELIDADVCESCGGSDFGPSFTEVLTKKEQAEWEELSGLLEDPHFMG